MAWRRRAVFFLASFIAVVTLSVRWAAFLLPENALGVWREFVTIPAILMLLYILLSEVFAPGPVTACDSGRDSGLPAAWDRLGERQRHRGVDYSGFLHRSSARTALCQ